MTRSRQREQIVRVAARIGFFASLFLVFACGWFAMRTTDWRKMVLLTALAVIAAVVASGFSRRSRS